MIIIAKSFSNRHLKRLNKRQFEKLILSELYLDRMNPEFFYGVTPEQLVNREVDPKTSWSRTVARVYDDNGVPVGRICSMFSLFITWKRANGK